MKRKPDAALGITNFLGDAQGPMTAGSLQINHSILLFFPTFRVPNTNHIYAPCMEYLPTFALKITQI